MARQKGAYGKARRDKIAAEAALLAAGDVLESKLDDSSLPPVEAPVEAPVVVEPLVVTRVVDDLTFDEAPKPAKPSKVLEVASTLKNIEVVVDSLPKVRQSSPAKLKRSVESDGEPEKSFVKARVKHRFNWLMRR